jgi:hypothetical protein
LRVLFDDRTWKATSTLSGEALGITRSIPADTQRGHNTFFYPRRKGHLLLLWALLQVEKRSTHASAFSHVKKGDPPQLERSPASSTVFSNHLRCSTTTPHTNNRKEGKGVHFFTRHCQSSADCVSASAKWGAASCCSDPPATRRNPTRTASASSSAGRIAPSATATGGA